MNPGGSVKDRIGRRMVMDAEKLGHIKKGDNDILIEPTSGNTGVGLSMAAAVKGYNMIITMPEKMSQEKQDALKGLGATIVRTPTENGFDHAQSHIGLAFEMERDLNAEHDKDASKPRARVLDQYKNPGNPMAHYDETGEEIWTQTGGDIDYLVAGAGTGGTITGIARKLKERAREHDRKIHVVGIDPNGSILALNPRKADPADKDGGDPDPKWGQQTEGIGYDFIPRVDQQHDLVDEWFRGPDKQSFLMARDLMRHEGFMCGGSSGTAMHGALQFLKTQKPDDMENKTMVVVLPDNIRNYMTKHLNDDWMYERGYITEDDCAKRAEPKHIANLDWGQDKTVADLTLHEALFLKENTTCQEAILMMRSKGFDQFPVKNASGTEIVGVLTAPNLLGRLGKNQLKVHDPIKKAVVKDLRNVSKKTKLNELVRVLKRNSFVLVEDKYIVTTSDIFDKRCPSLPYQESLLREMDDRKKMLEERELSIYRLGALVAGLSLGVVVGAALSSVLARKK